MAKQKQMKNGIQKTELTNEDKSIINRKMRPGIIVSFLIIIIGFGTVLSIFFLDKTEPKTIEPRKLWIPLVGIAVLANGIFMLMSRKHLSDLKDGFKYIMKRKIQEKELQSRKLIIENTYYKVEEKKFQQAQIGSEVLLHYAASSNNLIKIELKK